MRYYFVDFENVKTDGLEAIEQLSGEDLVYVLYSKNAENLKASIVNQILRSPAQISFVEITKLGQNALDFQLCTLMGVIIGQFEGDVLSIYIVSKDTGYDSVRDGIPLLLEQELQQRELALSICRITCIRDSLKKPAKKVKAKKIPPAESKAEWKEVRKALKGTEHQKNLGKILDIIRESAKKNHNLSKIYAGFVAEWGEEAGGELYRLIRRELKKDLK